MFYRGLKKNAYAIHRLESSLWSSFRYRPRFNLNIPHVRIILYNLSLEGYHLLYIIQ